MTKVDKVEVINHKHPVLTTGKYELIVGFENDRFRSIMFPHEVKHRELVKILHNFADDIDNDENLKDEEVIWS